MRRLTEPLDPLGRFLNLIANRVHTADRVLHGGQSGFGCDQRLTRHRGRFLRLGRHVVDPGSHVEHGLASLTDLPQLLGGCRQQFRRSGFHTRSCLGHTRRRTLHVAHQRAQLFHGVVHRVGDSTGDVLCHGGLLGQIALSHRLQFVHQPKNGRLVCVVDALALQLLLFSRMALKLGHSLPLATLAQLNVAEADGSEHRNHGRDEQRQEALPVEPRLGGQAGLQRLQILAQRFTVCHHGGLRFACGHQALQVAQNATRQGARFFVHLEQSAQALAGLLVARWRQAQLLTAVEQALCDLAERIQVFAQQEHGLRADALHRHELVGGLADTLRQHHQLTGGGDLSCRRVLLQLQ